MSKADVRRGQGRTVSGTAKALRHREQTHEHTVDPETGAESWRRREGWHDAAWDASLAGERLTGTDRDGQGYAMTFAELAALASVARSRKAAQAAKRARRELRAARRAAKRDAWRNPDVPDTAPVPAPVNLARSAMVGVAKVQATGASASGYGVPAYRAAVRREGSGERQDWRAAKALADATEAARRERIRQARIEALARARAAKALASDAAREVSELAAKRKADAAKRREGRRRVRVG